MKRYFVQTYEQVVHLNSIPVRERNYGGDSSQATLRHPKDTAYRCFLPEPDGVHGFPPRRTQLSTPTNRSQRLRTANLQEEFSLARADCE